MRRRKKRMKMRRRKMTGKLCAPFPCDSCPCESAHRHDLNSFHVVADRGRCGPLWSRLPVHDTQTRAQHPSVPSPSPSLSSSSSSLSCKGYTDDWFCFAVVRVHGRPTWWWWCCRCCCHGMRLRMRMLSLSRVAAWDGGSCLCCFL